MDINGLKLNCIGQRTLSLTFPTFPCHMKVARTTHLSSKLPNTRNLPKRFSSH